MGYRTRLVNIGNSKGIRIPRPLLKLVNLEGDVEIRVEDDQLIVRQVADTRQGWEAAFQRMAEVGDDHMLDLETGTDWDQAEWQW
jgi:antitoxin MazE